MDTPEHANLGDHGIALAERRALEAWFGRRSYFEVPADRIDGLERAFARLSPRSQTILVQGGGFLGTLWPDEELRFRRICEAYADHRIVVFPQTITLDRGTPALRRLSEGSLRAYASVPDLVMCCRDRATERLLAREAPEVRTALVPDVVLSLRVEDWGLPRDRVLMCVRSDEEAVLTGHDVERLRASLREAFPDLVLADTNTVLDHRVSMRGREAAVTDKLRELSRARLVVTDRLHGMLFCAVTGTPVIALNNCNGKVEGVYAWISSLPYVRFAGSVDEAVSLIAAGAPVPSRYPAHLLDDRFEELRSLLGGDA